MKYAIYWRWREDGFYDGDIFYSAKDRDVAIKDMLGRRDFNYIAYEPVYKSGEHGQRVTVCGTWDDRLRPQQEYLNELEKEVMK